MQNKYGKLIPIYWLDIYLVNFLCMFHEINVFAALQKTKLGIYLICTNYFVIIMVLSSACSIFKIIYCHRYIVSAVVFVIP